MIKEPNQYDQGQSVRVLAIFKNQAGILVDPTNVFFKVKDPASVERTYTYGTDPELIKESRGEYYIEVSADTPGFWYYRFWSTGSGQAGYQGTFRVRTSNVI